ncbi:MAG: DUF86 domain-containing protein [Methanoregula sp.]
MRLLAQLQTLDDALLAWQRYQQIPYEKVAQDIDTQYMIRHAMLLAIQASIDLATGMAVTKTSRRPDTYRETFHLLGTYGVIPEELAGELSNLAGFRNILVHEYARLDVKRVHRTLMEDWQTMDAFRRRAQEFIKEHTINPGEPGSPR